MWSLIRISNAYFKGLEDIIQDPSLSLLRKVATIPAYTIVFAIRVIINTAILLLVLGAILWILDLLFNIF